MFRYQLVRVWDMNVVTSGADPGGVFQIEFSTEVEPSPPDTTSQNAAAHTYIHTPPSLEKTAGMRSRGK